MNATHTTARTAQLRLAPQNSVKLATCAILSLIITLLTGSIIAQATGAHSISSSSAPALTASLR